MHHIIHIGLQLVFMCVTAILFTMFIVHRPGATHPATRRTVVSSLVVGLVISLVFLATHALYSVVPFV